MPSTISLTPLDEIIARHYVRWLFCFPTQPEYESNIITTLQHALDQTAESQPIITGKVVERTLPDGDDRSGRLEVRTSSFGPRLLIKDWRKQDTRWNKAYAEGEVDGTMDVDQEVLNETWSPSYDALAARNMPQDEMDGDRLAATPFGVAPGNVQHVMAAQLNLVRGGCILCVSFHHSVTDATGFSAVLETWAEKCRFSKPNSRRDSAIDMFEGFSDREKLLLPRFDLEDRSVVFDRLSGRRDYWSVLGLDPVDAPWVPAEKNAQNFIGRTATMIPDDMETITFRLSPSAMLELKELAFLNHSKYRISTHDALMAFLWKSIMLARFEGTCNSIRPSESVLSFTCDLRNRLHPALSPDYVGNAIGLAQTIVPLEDLISPATTLSDLAQMIRKPLDDMENGQLEASVDLAASIPDMRRVSYPFATFLGADLCIASWANLPLYKLDWGFGLGKPQFMRTPRGQFDKICRTCIIQPEQLDGSLEVQIGLGSDEMSRLRRIPEFAKFTKVVC